MTVSQAGGFVRRWWWLLVLLPLIGLVAGVVLTRDQPYQSSIRATVLIPWDPEIPGSSERPELMVLDDAPALVSSYAFAELVHAALPVDLQTVMSVDDVESALAASRYSRVLTVTASRDDSGEAEAIATAAAAVLRDAVNSFLVADGADQATVRIIDPASDATQDRTGRIVRIVAQAGAALVLALVVAILLDSVLRPEQSAVTESADAWP
jgi:capsular polysaccharide biosynthesis protein